MLSWMSNIIQNPSRKSEITTLLRDEGILFQEDGGTGKSLFFEQFFGYEIIGEEYVYIVKNNKDYNLPFEGKLLIIVEEDDNKYNHQNHDNLKSKITSKKLNINKKCIDQYTIKDYSNYLFFSNNINPLHIKQGNRRIAVFDTNPIKRGDVSYFKTLTNELLNNNEVKWAFYQFLKEYKTYKDPIEFQTNIPNTNGYREFRKLNASLPLQWVLYELKNGTLKDDTVRNLYNKFKSWVRDMRESSDDRIMTETAFGILLNNSNKDDNDYNIENFGVKKRNKKNMFMVWDKVSIISSLKTLGLLELNFEYDNVNNNEDNSDFEI